MLRSTVLGLLAILGTACADGGGPLDPGLHVPRPVDSGLHWRDAGPRPPLVRLDAGRPADAGTTRRDGGTELHEGDAGATDATDAGPPTPDAGPVIPADPRACGYLREDIATGRCPFARTRECSSGGTCTVTSSSGDGQCMVCASRAQCSVMSGGTVLMRCAAGTTCEASSPGCCAVFCDGPCFASSACDVRCASGALGRLDGTRRACD